MKQGRRSRKEKQEEALDANQIPGRVTVDPMAMAAAVVVEYRRSAVTVKDSLTSASPVVKEFRSKSHCCVFAIQRGTWRANDPCPILPRTNIRFASKPAVPPRCGQYGRCFFVFRLANYLNCKFAAPRKKSHPVTGALGSPAPRKSSASFRAAMIIGNRDCY